MAGRAMGMQGQGRPEGGVGGGEEAGCSGESGGEREGERAHLGERGARPKWGSQDLAGLMMVATMEESAHVTISPKSRAFCLGLAEFPKKMDVAAERSQS